MTRPRRAQRARPTRRRPSTGSDEVRGIGWELQGDKRPGMAPQRLETIESAAANGMAPAASIPNIGCAGGECGKFARRRNITGVACVGVPRKLQILAPNPLKALARRQICAAGQGKPLPLDRRGGAFLNWLREELAAGREPRWRYAWKGLDKDRARDLQDACLAKFGKLSEGGLLLNRFGYQRASAEAIAFFRRSRRQWFLPPIGRAS